MKKMMRLILILVIALMVVVGCGNKNQNDNDDENENKDSNVEAKSDNDDGGQVLKLGETGTIKDTLGEYEVTPTSFVAVDEWDGEKPKLDGDVYVIIDVTIKNIGESVLEGEEVRKVDAVGGQDVENKNNVLIDKTNQFEGEIKPGEEMEGQLAFSLIPTDSYQLIFGLHLGSVSNKVTWELDADDAS